MTDARLLGADSAPADWLSHGRNHANQRFSPLTQIDRENVAGPTRLWRYECHRLSRAPDRNESTPIAFDGLLVYSAPRRDLPNRLSG